MKIAIYGRQFNDTVLPYVQQVFNALTQHQVDIYVYKDLDDFLAGKINIGSPYQTFTRHQPLKGLIDVLLTLGGDGTLLDTVAFIHDSGIPVVGINFGRLGFLASISKSDIADAIHAVVHRDFTLDSRVLLTIESENHAFNGDNIALNDITFHKRDDSAMITIHAYLNGELLNSYWADGIIVSTPTGSTAYALSCGGPIVLPRSGNIIITPVAPHNLNVRPIVLSDDSVLSFEVECRSANYLVSCDSRTVIIDTTVKFSIRKASFELNLLRLNNETYLTTLRNKLLWGIDARNY
ncbi:NAD kinase [Mucilaginibacter paludis]|uniref:NAD kinase n=1 Tax=Mucilaginibacter paludis DSM 18603 TaxID=714943 RepID=H1Y9E2_9SPHI|nr:NAD kinase [Mucilaginibacter paludis]EHQ29947.1 inorganic polyphosphate/ATP-NAD kinase [Mucilaginibacter paludis DSM 18603]